MLYPALLTEQRASRAAPDIITADTITNYVLADASTNSTLSRFLSRACKSLLPKFYNAVADGTKALINFLLLSFLCQKKGDFVRGRTLVIKMSVCRISSIVEFDIHLLNFESDVGTAPLTLCTQISLLLLKNPLCWHPVFIGTL